MSETFGQRIKADHDERDGRKVEAEAVEEVARCNKTGGCEKAKSPGTRERDSACRKMAHGGAGIGGIEAAIDDAIEGHGTSACANHRGDNETKGAPTGPAAVIASGYGHRSQGEGKREDGVGEFNEFSPGTNVGKHRG